MKDRPVMVTTQPWQVFAWIAARHRELYIRVASVKLRNPWMGPPGFEFPGFSPSRDHRRTGNGVCPQAGILARLDYGPFGADKHSSL
jgi:hypothetical protein